MSSKKERRIRLRPVPHETLDIEKLAKILILLAEQETKAAAKRKTADETPLGDLSEGESA